MSSEMKPAGFPFIVTLKCSASSCHISSGSYGVNVRSKSCDASSRIACRTELYSRYGASRADRT